MKKTLQCSKITLDFDFAIRFINNDTISAMILELYTSLYILVDYPWFILNGRLQNFTKKLYFMIIQVEILPSTFTWYIHSRGVKAHYIIQNCNNFIVSGYAHAENYLFTPRAGNSLWFFCKYIWLLFSLA